MDENLLKQEKIAAADMRRPWMYVAFIGLWPGLLVLAMMQMHCVPFPFLRNIYPLAAIAGGVASLCFQLVALRRNGGKLMISGQLKTVTRGFAARIVAIMVLGLSLVSFLASYVLLGDFILLTSHTPHDFDATVMGVWGGPKHKCKNEVVFVDDVLQTSVNECARDTDEVRTGVRVHVHALSGPLGVKFLSVQRIHPEQRNQ